MFKFKGISSTDMQVVIEEEEHFIAKASKRYEVTEIEGRDGAIFDESGYSYVERPIYVQCLNLNKIDDILAWLDGEGEFEYKGRKTIARFYSELEPKREGYIRIIDTTFIRDPFWIKANEEFVTVKESKVTETEEAKSIHVEDASTIGQLEVLGNHEQETREGYNLLNNTLKSRTINGLTVVVNKDKSVSINGTATANTNIIFDKRLINTLAAGTYTLKDCQTYIDSEENNGWWNASTTAVTKTFTKTPQLSTFGFYLYFSSGTTVNKTYYPALVKGTEEKPYEQYGAMPSPEFESPIICLGSNKNLFDVWENGSFTNQGEEIESSGIIRTPNYIEVKENVEYTFKIYDESINNIAMFEYNENKSFIKVTYNLNSEQTILMSENTKYIKMRIVSSDINLKMKFEEGDTATSYSPHGQGSTLISKINKNIYDIAKYPFTNRIAYNSSGGQVFWDGYCGILDYFPVKSNTQYTFSNNLNKPILYGLVFYDKDKQFISATTSSTTTFTTPEKCEYIRFAIQSDTLPSWVQIEVGNTATDYIKHQQVDYLLYIQQEMLKGDYFIKEEDGWKEVHGWNKYEFTGNENISYSSANKVFYTDMFTNKQSGTNNFIVNAFRVISTDSYANMPNYSSAGNSTSSRVVFKYTELTSIEEFKQFLKERYNAGNSVYVFYKATTPTKLVCTEEQTAVLEELNNMDLFEGVNNIITAEDIALLKLKYMKITDEKINNEGNVESRPILRLEKTSTESVELTINNCRFKYNFNDEEYVEIDCEQKEVKYEGLNRNRQIEIGYEFPILNVGDNDIKMHSGDCVIKVLRKDRWL